MNETETIKEIMSTRLKTIESSKKVLDALQMMHAHDIGSLIVLQAGNGVGIITERDITRKLAATPDILDMKIENIASKPLVTASPETPIWEAFERMLRKKIRRLPIVANGKIVGIVTERDLFRWVVKVAYEPNVPTEIRKLVQTVQVGAKTSGPKII